MHKFGTAVILAGGKSSRMGFDKQLIQLNDENIIEHIAQILLEEFSEILLVSNSLPNGKYEKFEVIKDAIENKGPLSGIHSGLLSAQSDFVYFIACDMPIINLDYIRHMKKVIKRSTSSIRACVTRYKEWIEPFNSFYHKDITLLIEDHLKEEQSVYSLIKKTETIYIPESTARKFSKDWNMFLNINTTEDLERFLDNEKNKICRNA
jgi:molybdopterin-guanine dinucleotide biosynthesis protein A